MAGGRQSVLLLSRLLFDSVLIIALSLTQIMSCAVLDKPMVPADPVVDPEVRALARTGTARVLVMLQVAEISDERAPRRSDRARPRHCLGASFPVSRVLGAPI